MNYISEKAQIGDKVSIGANCIIEDNVRIEDNCYIDSNTIIRSGTSIGRNTFIGANCIIGEYLMDFCLSRKEQKHSLSIGSNTLIRSGSIIYTQSSIGPYFQTGHRVTIREGSQIGCHVSVGTLSDIQGNCHIGDYVRMHSNVHIGQLSSVDNFVWIFPYVVLTNDPTPPSTEDNFRGVHVNKFALISTGAILLPGVRIGRDALVGAAANVTRDVEDYSVVVGNPAKKVKDVREMKNIKGDKIYPWRFHFNRAMAWHDSNFRTWYSKLTEEERRRYQVDDSDL